MKPLQLIRDVETRWSSIYLMIDRAIILREVYFKLILYLLMLKSSQAITKFLEEQGESEELNDEDWEALDLMRQILQVCLNFLSYSYLLTSSLDSTHLSGGAKL